jgi:hypothetical protein
MRRALLLLCIAAMAALATTAAARAEEEYVFCRVSADDPNVVYGQVGGEGRVNCTATVPWNLEVCLQKWVRPDDLFYDVTCRSFPGERPFGSAEPRISCDVVGRGEYRLWVHASWDYGGSHNDWAFSNVTWDC